MRTLLLFLAASIIFLVGCTQAVEKTTGELQMCVDSCQNACNVLNETNTSLGGFNQLTLTKQSGGVRVSCSCQCG